MNAPIPPPPPTEAPGGTRSGRARTWAIIILVLLGGLAMAGVLVVVNRSPGPPGAPANPEAKATTCDHPCREIHPRVTLTWTDPAEGGEVTGYRVIRDGAVLPGADAIDPATHVVVDDSVVFGRTYTYRIVALGEPENSPPSGEVSAEASVPPVTAAQLDGIYDVRLTVRSARSLSAMLGIENPVPGKHASDQWTFDASCAPESAACPSRWEGLDGAVRPDRMRWRGAVAGPEARCGGGTTVAAPIDFDLRTVDAVPDDARWVVGTFQGTVAIRFSCPGFGPSSGSVEVSAVRT